MDDKDLFILPPFTRRQLIIISEGISTGLDWYTFDDEEEAVELHEFIEDILHQDSEPAIVE